MSRKIERTSPVPYYQQLYDILRSRVIEGEFATDQRLPSENELCREFGLSRATVRQTLAKLEDDGFARRVARRGVFASTPEEPSGWTVQEGFLESQIRHGRTGIVTTVVFAGVVDAPAHVVEVLGVGPGEKVYALERVRSLDGEPAMFSTNWFPADVGDLVASAEDVVAGAGSLNAMLRHAGFVAQGAHRVIRALRPSEKAAVHLGVSMDAPVLQVRSTSWDGSDRRFDYYETWVVTDVLPLEVDVSAT